MQVTIDDESGSGVAREVERFEEVKLDTGEVARCVIPVERATAEYIHELKPVIIANGVIQMETKNRKDKTTYEVYATGFKGRKVCTGIVDIDNPEDPAHPLPGPMRTKGVDPENCIVCAACVELGIASLKAELRYAIPVIRITTRGKTSTDIQEPPSAKILVLPLTWRQYDDLAKNLKGIRELFGWGPEVKIKPNMADIVIECEDGGFKRYNWRPPMRSHWQKQPGSEEVRNPALRQAIFGLWKNPDNRPTEEQLVAACGKAGDVVFLQQDLNEVTESYAMAKAIERGEPVNRPADTAQAATGDLTDGLAGLDDIDSILGGEDSPPAETLALLRAPLARRELPAAADVPGAVPADGLSGLDEFETATTSNPAAPNGNGAKPAAAPAVAAAVEEDPFDGATETAPPAVAKAPAPAAEAESFDKVWDEL